jgi:hypothetical protein
VAKRIDCKYPHFILFSGEKLAKSTTGKAKKRKACKKYLEATYGVDRGRVTSFTEYDRGEDRQL